MWAVFGDLMAGLLGAFVLILVCALAVVGFTIAVTLSARIGLKDAAFGALVAAFPNSGFMGVPLLVAMMGPAAAGPVICTVLADMVVTSTLCVGLAQSQQRGASGQAGHGATRHGADLADRAPCDPAKLGGNGPCDGANGGLETV